MTRSTYRYSSYLIATPSGRMWCSRWWSN